MKKITILAVAALAISFASCKKDYTCTCTHAVTGGGSGTSTTVIKGVSKSQAKANCLSSDDKDDDGTVYQTNTCSLS